jgi:signal transduction histidine kinase/DNA-binding response OmpR family regulator/CHASE3 domain sensor protein
MRWLRKWLDLSLRAKCLLLISFPAAATVAMAGASYLAGARTAAATQELNRNLQIGIEIERLRTSEIETNAHVRGYVITADEPFAKKARGSFAAFDAGWQKAFELTADDRAQRERLSQVAALERSRVELMSGETARFRSRNLSLGQLRAVLNASESERLKLERILQSMEQANSRAIEAGLLHVKQLQMEKNTISAICLLLGLIGGVTMTLLFAQGIINRVGKLNTNITELAKGGSNIDSLPGWDEIGALNEGLMRIKRLLQHRRGVLDSALHGIAEVDSQGRYRWFNKAYGEIAGVSEVYRPPTLKATLPVESRAGIDMAVRAMKLGGRAEIIVCLEPPRHPATEVEMTFLCPPGMPDGGFYVFLRETTSGQPADPALIRARDAAVASDHAKTDFLAKISHDIRTPLNAILGSAELLSHTALSFDQSEYVHMFQRNCRRLGALINDFLDFSRIEAGAVQVENAPLQIREIVNDAAATFRLDAARKAIGLGVDVDPQLPEWIVGDSLRIQQVLVNLLSNALKFTITGRVDIRLRVEEDVQSSGRRLRCEVLDTGPGIAADDQDKIFMKFIQLPNQTVGQRGTGLGLTICRDLVKLMGGEIGVASQPGGGSNFHFSLPLEAAQHSGAQLGAPAASEISLSVPGWGKLPAPNGAIRILVAEDTEDNRVLIEHYLRPEQVELRFAFTGREAVDLVQRGEKFDLILMDIDMPVLDGFGAARAIRAWETSHGGATPIVALSADAMGEAVQSSLDAGCVAHVAKPVDRGTLLKTIQRYANVHGARSIQPAVTTLEVSQQVRALVPQYLESKHRQIEEAREALTARDFGPIRRFGHNLKGTGRGYGFPAIEEMGRQIENAAAQADVDRIAQQLDALHRFVSESSDAATDPVSAWSAEKIQSGC